MGKNEKMYIVKEVKPGIVRLDAFCTAEFIEGIIDLTKSGHEANIDTMYSALTTHQLEFKVPVAVKKAPLTVTPSKVKPLV